MTLEMQPGTRAPIDLLSRFVGETIVIVDMNGRIMGGLPTHGGPLGDDPLAGKNIFDFCHPDDLPACLEAASASLEQADGRRRTLGVRFHGPSGNWRKYQVELFNETTNPAIGGFVLRIASKGAVIHRTAIAGLTPAESDGSLIELVPTPIMLFGPRGTAFYMNDAARALCDPYAPDIGTFGFPALAHREDRPEVRARFEKLVESGGQDSLTFRLRKDRPDQPDRFVEARVEARGEPGCVSVLIATLIDVTDHHEEASELRRRARTDQLTGLLNWGAITELLNRELAEGDPERISVLYLDLDGFKMVNDTFGHDVGDQLIRAVGTLLSASCGERATVGRIGGDEFIIVATDEDESTIDALVSSAMRAVGVAGHVGFITTASVGTAQGREGDVARDLIRRADHAMYDHKRWRLEGPAH